jgi:uncharacterized iron-regulated membrane protein
MSSGGLYPTIWRWHFYAGLFVLPFVLLLSLTGSVYLFKPQIDRWEERAFHGLSTEGTATSRAQVEATLHHLAPGSTPTACPRAPAMPRPSTWDCRAASG